MLSILVCHSYFLIWTKSSWSAANPIRRWPRCRWPRCSEKRDTRYRFFDAMLAEDMEEFDRSSQIGRSRKSCCSTRIRSIS